MSTATTNTKPEQPALLAIETPDIKAADKPSAAVKASAAERKKKPLPEPTGFTEIIVQIPLGLIAPSPWNPRKRFDKEYIANLAASIASSGVHQPIVVREWVARAEDIQLAIDHGFDPSYDPGANIFQIVSGECRSIASSVAGKETVPAVVRPLTNEQAEEAQIIENLQRKDLDPLDEAEGFYRLMTLSPDRPKPMTGQELAAKIGMSPQHVSSRVRLCELAEWGKQILRNGWITPGHAVLIARLGDAGTQGYAMEAVFSVGGRLKKEAATMVESVRPLAEAGAPIMSEKLLRTWIAENIKCDLKTVPWDKADADLYPAAGACDGCQFRTKTDPALFAEINPNGEDRCTKPQCFQAKLQRHIHEEQENARLTGNELLKISMKPAQMPALPNAKVLLDGQWVEAKRGECKQTVRVIVIDGEMEGHTPFVCVDAKCKVHKHPAVAVPMEPQKTLTTKDTKEHGGGAGNDPEFHKTPAGIAAAGPYNPGATVIAKGGNGLPAQPGVAAVHDSKEERDRLMESQRLRAVAAVKELMVHRVLAAQAAHEQKDVAAVLREACEYHLENSYIDNDRVVAGLGWDPDKFPNAEPIGEALESGKVPELARLLWLLMVPDSIDIESDRVQAWAKARKVDLEKIQVDLEEKLSYACYYCGCTELTPCEVPLKDSKSGKCSRMRSGTGVSLHGAACDADACIEAARKEWESGARPQTPVNQKPMAPTKVLATVAAKTPAKTKPSQTPPVKAKAKPPAKTAKPKAVVTKQKTKKPAAKPKARK